MRIGSRAAVLVFLLAGWGAGTSLGADKTPHFAIGRPLDVLHIRLEMAVDLEQSAVESTAILSCRALQPLQTIELDAVGFEDVAVNVERPGAASAACEFENNDEQLILDLATPLEAGESITISVSYKLRDPKRGLHFYGPDDGNPDEPRVMWSQGQSISNRHWVPCFDHPNEMQTTEILCTVKKPYTAVSNGKLVERRKNEDGTLTYHWLQDKPHVSYLMALAVGEFVSKTDKWRGKDISYYVRPKFEDWIDNSFGNTTRMLEYFSTQLGVEYPWDKYAQVSCYGFGGGMENTSCTILGESTLHDHRAHLDMSSDDLVAHELAHQWFGDLVTCREWAHLWLNEGFATYFEAVWTEYNLGPEEFAYEVKKMADRARSAGRKKPVVYRKYASAGEQFDGRAYSKGGTVLHMIRRRLGDEMFWSVLKTYLERFRHRPVETVDLRKIIEEVSGRSFERFFYDWTERSGSPKVSVLYRWRADKKMARLVIKQTQGGEPFHFPLKLEFRFPGETDPYRFTADMKDHEATHEIALEQRPNMLRVDPQNAVLMQLSETKPRALWVSQLTDDPNPVARLAAIEYFDRKDADRDRELLVRRLNEDGFWAVRVAITRALADAVDEDVRDALLKALSAKHPKVRKEAAKALENHGSDERVEAALLRIVKEGDESYWVEEAAIDAWATVCTDDPMEVLSSLLERDSFREIIRSAALKNMAWYVDDDSFSQLVAWSRPEKPERCREAAYEAIATAVALADLSAEQKEDATELICSALSSETGRVQRAIIGALSEKGELARKMLPLLDDVVSTADWRTSRRAKRAAEKIRKVQSSEINALRDELKKLREQIERLAEPDTQEDEDEAGRDPGELGELRAAG